MIYFVESAGRVKIGYSTNPKSRFGKIVSDSPFPATLLGVMDGDETREKALHDWFSDSRHHGEWFEMTDALQDFIFANARPVDGRRERIPDSALGNWRKALETPTLEAAGALIGVSAVQMMRLEKGERRIPADRLVEIERITGIPRQSLRPDLFEGMAQERA